MGVTTLAFWLVFMIIFMAESISMNVYQWRSDTWVARELRATNETLWEHCDTLRPPMDTWCARDALTYSMRSSYWSLWIETNDALLFRVDVEAWMDCQHSSNAWCRSEALTCAGYPRNHAVCGGPEPPETVQIGDCTCVDTAIPFTNKSMILGTIHVCDCTNEDLDGIYVH